MEKEKTKVQKEVDLLTKKSTKDNLLKLDKLSRKAKDEKDREYARLMKENFEFYFYYPQNDKEFQELLLIWQIRKKKRWILGREMKIKAARYELDEYSFDKKIHARILKKQTAENKEKWKYNYFDDFPMRTQNRLAELEDDVAYELEWIKEAKKMIKTKRYHELPDDYFINNIFDFQNISAWEDDEKECCCNCGCDK